MDDETEIHRSRWQKDRNEHLLNTNYVPSPIIHSPTLYHWSQIYSAIKWGRSSRHSQSSFHDFTPLSGHAGFTAVFRHCLGNSFGQGPNTRHWKPEHIWETLLGKALSQEQSLWVSPIVSELNDLTPTCHLPILKGSGISVELLVWRRQRQVGKGDKAG